jgi:glycosyltransferase involved in cell wall biosynthesis
MSAPTISLVIIAQDEERNIARVLAAAKDLVDEMIVVDSGSTDKTCSIAESAGARVIHQDWLGFAAQKNFALDQAKCDWILSLDADEVLTDSLRAEIAALKSGLASQGCDGYRIPRILYIGDQPVRHGGFYPDAQLRLIRRGAGRFGQRMVHEAIKMASPTSVVKTLQHPMLHYAYRSVSEFNAAMDKYARLSAQEYFKSPGYERRLNPFNYYVHPLWTFFYRYFGRGGVLDGGLGFALATIYSDYVRKKVYYLKQLAKGKTV